MGAGDSKGVLVGGNEVLVGRYGVLVGRDMCWGSKRRVGAQSPACISLSWAALACVSFQMGLMSKGTYLRLETRLRRVSSLVCAPNL